MIKKHTAGKKPKAQAMVEFALVLLLLLTLLYGILEAGRLLFIYASVITATRQAVRYGSATGLNASNIPYYLDCAGIRNAAKRVGFITAFQDSDIHITYDAGVDSATGNPKDISGYPDADDYGAEACDGNTNLQSKIANGYRVRVQISADWIPISPIVPIPGFTITKQSARTILVNVSVAVTAAPQGWSGTGTGTLSLGISASPTTYSTVGQVITYTYTVTNTSATASVAGPFSITSGRAPSTCPTAPSTLAAGGSFTCTGTYQITQADLDAGSVLTVSAAQASGASSGNAAATVMAEQSPAITIAKSASPTIASSVGTVITYTYTLTNSGNVTLSSPYSVLDVPLGTVGCTYAGTLAPGAGTTCTKTYSITTNDMDAGEIVNQATATAYFNSTLVTSGNTATATVTTSYLILTVTTSPQTATQANQVITYTYYLYNNSASVLNSLNVTDTKGTVTCAASSLAPGASTSCSRTYTVSQAEMDAGGSITSKANATANGGTIKAPAVNTSVPITQSVVLSLSISASPSMVLIANTVVTYTYTLTNSGNVTLSPTFSVTDTKFGPVPCTLATTLLPAATTTCTKTYTMTQTDIDNGPVINKATASATFNSQTVTSSEQFVAVATYNGARLKLTISPDINPVTTGAGTVITYTYTLQNTGSVSLTSPYSVTDSKVSSVNCASATSPLVIGATTTCSGSYTVTSADVIAGSVTNQAKASAQNGATAVSSNQASVTILTSGPIVCKVYHRLSTVPAPSITYPTQKTMRITITSSSTTATTIHIGSIELHGWNPSTPSGQYVSNITFGGKTTVIYTGSSADNYVPITFSAPFTNDVSLAPGASKVLEFTFDKNYNPTSNPSTERIIVNFLENGCPKLDTDNSTYVGLP